MAEPQQPLPAGAPRFVRFDGVIEGRTLDPDRLDPAVARLNALPLAPAELEIEGGRWSLLLDDRRIPGARATPGALEDFVERLNDLLEASGDPASAESTLRCVEVFEGRVRETLFLAEGGRVRSLSRLREVAESGEEPPPPGVLRRMGLRRALPIAGALLVAFGILAYRSGYVDRLFAPAPGALRIDPGPFGGDLQVELERRWGNYRVTVRRGETFPAEVAELERRRREASGLEQRAALEILSSGGAIYAQLRDRKGRVLESRRFELRPLLADPGARVEVPLPGNMLAVELRLSLAEKDGA